MATCMVYGTRYINKRGKYCTYQTYIIMYICTEIEQENNYNIKRTYEHNMSF